MVQDSRHLLDLCSVGPATIKDFNILGIQAVDQLKKKKAESLYNELCNATKTRHDPCVIDVFRAAIEQAKNPILEPEKCNWWYWSRIRKRDLK